MQTPQITAVVFDLGNVLVGWNPYLALVDRMSPGEWQEFAEEVDFAALNAMSDLGVPIKEVAQRAGEKDPRYGELIEHYFEHFDRALTGPIPGVAEIVDELKAADLRVLGLTNWSDETFGHGPRIAPAINRLDAVVISGREGLAKPDPKLFQLVVERHGLVPQQTVFVDDSRRNVEAASELGFVGVGFIDAPQLRETLANLGLLA